LKQVKHTLAHSTQSVGYCYRSIGAVDGPCTCILIGLVILYLFE